MTKLNPYLTFPGTAAEAVKLYKKVFNKEPVFLQRFKDMPDSAKATAGKPEGAGLSAEAMAKADERILHAMFQIGDDQLMISDAPEGQDNTVVVGSQTHVSVTPDSREEADRVFGELSEGGRVTMPMADAFWGDYFGMCTDRFGMNWMINYQKGKK